MSVNVTDLASFAVAGATLVLAFVTWRMAAQAKKGVEVAAQEAAATARLASAAQTDRELAWRPHVVIEPGDGSGGSADAFTDVLTVRNVGPGPALNCVCIVRDDERGWGCSTPFSLMPGGDHKVTIKGPSPDIEDPAAVLTATPGGGWRPGTRRLVRCVDVLDRHWRFPERLPPQQWRKSDPPEPWVTWEP